MIYQVLQQWYQKYFSDPEAVILLFLIIATFLVIMFFGDILAPILASVVIAYVLDWMVDGLEKYRIPRWFGVWFVFFVFLGILVVLSLWIIPLLIREITSLINELPMMITSGQNLLYRLTERYPEIVSQAQIDQLTTFARAQLAPVGQQVLSVSIASIVSVMSAIIYIIVVPFVVFFFVKDRDEILTWCKGFLPKEHNLLTRVWNIVDAQLGNYIRGKIVELIIVFLMTWIVFAAFGLEYSLLLSVFVGLSIFIPYIGGVVSTIPIVLVAFFQWGLGTEFIWLMVAYTITQILDGSILVPILFSEAVSMHPVVIILAIIIFGGLWGFWGLFFAIPLAIVFKALIEAWPRAQVKSVRAHKAHS